MLPFVFEQFLNSSSMDSVHVQWSAVLCTVAMNFGVHGLNTFLTGYNPKHTYSKSTPHWNQINQVSDWLFLKREVIQLNGLWRNAECESARMLPYDASYSHVPISTLSSLFPPPSMILRGTTIVHLGTQSKPRPHFFWHARTRTQTKTKPGNKSIGNSLARKYVTVWKIKIKLKIYRNVSIML